MPAVELKIGGSALHIADSFARFRRQVPFAASRALNDAARQAVKDYRAALPGIFDRPTPFTLNSAFMRPATKEKLEAAVELRHFAGKGTPADRYLGPEILGGDRNLKRFEKALSAKGILAPGQFTVPGRGAQRDGYGNMSRGQIVKILSRLNAAGEQSIGSRATARLGRAGLRVKHGRRLAPGDYFVARGPGGKGPARGVYQLVGAGKVVPVLIFTRRPPMYRKRLDFFGLIQASAAKNFGRFFAERFRQAVETAR